MCVVLSVRITRIIKTVGHISAKFKMVSISLPKLIFISLRLIGILCHWLLWSMIILCEIMHAVLLHCMAITSSCSYNDNISCLYLNMPDAGTRCCIFIRNSGYKLMWLMCSFERKCDIGKLVSCHNIIVLLSCVVIPSSPRLILMVQMLNPRQE